MHLLTHHTRVSDASTVTGHFACEQLTLHESEGQMSIFILKCISLLWQVIALTALAVLLTWRCCNYFTYPTTSKTFFNTPHELEIPDVSLCFSLQSLLTNSSRYFFQENDNKGIFLNKSIGQLFDASPSSDETLVSCAYRNRYSNSLIFRNSTDCVNESFNVTKYRFHGYICYKYRLSNKSEPFSLFGIAYALHDPNVIYKLSLGYKMMGHKMCAIIHQNEFPTEERNLNQEILPSRSRSQIFELSYVSITIHRLKPPYDTDCRDRPRTGCILNCARKVYSKYKLARPYDLSLDDERDFIMPSQNDTYSGKKLIQIMAETSKQCAYKCPRPECIFNVTRTFVALPYEDESQGKLTFTIKNIAHPILVLQYQVAIELNDFLTELANLAAIFVSFSVLDFTLFVSQWNKKKHFFVKLNEIIFKVNSITMRNRSFAVNNVINLTLKDKNKLNDKASRLKKFTFLFIRSLIILSSSYQIFSLSYNYFAYSTMMTLSFDVNPIIDQYPKLAICFDAHELLSNDSDDAFLNASNYHEMEIDKAISLNFTLGELMQKIPDADDLIGGCRLRPDQNMYPALQRYNGSDCLKFFNIYKFFWSESFCYNFMVINAPFNQTTVFIEYFRQQTLKALVVHPGLLYTVIVGERFHNIRAVDASVYPANIEFTSDTFAVTLFQKEKNNTLGLLSYHVVNITLLPRPYQTDCNVPENELNTCFDDCLLDRTHESQRLPREGLWNNSKLYSHMKIESYFDTSDETFYRELVDIYRHCNRNCRPCKIDESITYLRSIGKSQEKLEFAIDIHANPIWFLKAVAEIPLYRYLFDLFCCCNFWFGLSFLTFDPADFIIRRVRAQSLVVKQYITIKKFTHHLLQLMNQTKSKKQFILMRIKKFIRRRYIFIILILPACLVHLFGEVQEYLDYPSTMYLRTEYEDNIDDEYELAICLDIRQILAIKSNSSVDSFSLQGITLAQMFSEAPKASDLVTACGFRGINGSGNANNATDSLFFYATSSKQCLKIFKYRVYLLKGFICYQFYKTPKKESNLMARHIGSLMIAMNSSQLTRRLLVTVAEADDYPMVGSVWAVDLKLQPIPFWYRVSYSKYIQYTLPDYYSHGDFKNVVYGKCRSKCLDENLKPLKLLYHALHTQEEYNRSDFSYLTAQDRTRPSVAEIFTKSRRNCTQICINNDGLEVDDKFEYLATDIMQMGDQRFFQINDSQSFYLYRTEYPVTIVSFSATITLLQLLITLCSIIAIWFGLSFNSLASALADHSHDKDVSLDKLNQLDGELNKALGSIRQLEVYLAKRRRIRRPRMCYKCNMPLW